MRGRRVLIIAGCLGALGGAAAIPLIRPGHVIDAKLLRVQGFSDTSTNEHGDIVLQITRFGAPDIDLADEQALEFRIAGKWLSKERLDGRFLALDRWPGCGRVAYLPNRRRAEAFRLHLTYRRPSLRGEAMLWLLERGWWSKAPRVCEWLCRRLPEHRKWRQALVEFELPKEAWWCAPGYEP